LPRASNPPGNARFPEFETKLEKQKNKQKKVKRGRKSAVEKINLKSSRTRDRKRINPTDLKT